MNKICRFVKIKNNKNTIFKILSFCVIIWLLDKRKQNYE